MDKFSKNSEYDLEERTTKFSESIIDFCKECPKNIISIPLIDQLIRSATSIGANYHEANGAASRKDFFNKIYLCKKEAKETMYWLQLIAKAEKSTQDPCRQLWKEVHELVLIFSKITSRTK